MKNLISLYLIAFVCIFSACKKDCTIVDPIVEAPKSTIKLVFNASFDGQPLEFHTDYLFGAYPVRFTRFTLFVTNISLMKGTVETKLSEAEFLDFFAANSSGSVAVNPRFSYKNIASDDYTGLKIGFGVSPDLNAKKPADFPATHALANETEYWSGWKSYIFSKIEANAELIEDPNSTTNDYESFLNYHCGSAAAQQVDIATSFTFEQPIAVSGTEKQINVNLDLKKLFTLGTKMLNITEPDNQFTGTNPNDLLLAKKLMDNWKNATTIN
jgi:hypothetical protein